MGLGVIAGTMLLIGLGKPGFARLCPGLRPNGDANGPADDGNAADNTKNDGDPSWHGQTSRYQRLWLPLPWVIARLCPVQVGAAFLPQRRLPVVTTNALNRAAGDRD